MGNTPPWSPTPVDVSVPTPHPSPPKTTVQVSGAAPPPPVSLVAPPPPVSDTPISTTPLSPPIISHATATTITSTPIIITSTINSFVNVNTSDVGEMTEDPPKVTTKPLSPTHSSESDPVLGGAEFEFDSTYYNPYRIPSDEDEVTPTTKQQIDIVDEKLDALLDNQKKYNDVLLKAFLDTALQQYHESIDKSTAAIDDSTSLCKRATSEVKELIQDSKVFLESLYGHAETNAAKVNTSIDALSQSLHSEQAKFQSLRTDIVADKKNFLSSVDSRLETLIVNFSMERQLRADLAQKASTLAVQKVDLEKVEWEIALLKTKHVVFRSCAGDVINMVNTMVRAHDPILTLTIHNDLTSKLLPVIELLHEMKGVTERMVPLQQGGEGSQVPKIRKV